MYLPEPLLSLVVAYLTDGNPVPRILRQSRPARVGEARDWAAVRRLMDLKAYELLQRERLGTGLVYTKMKMVLRDEERRVFAQAVIDARASSIKPSSLQPPYADPPGLYYHLIWPATDDKFWVHCTLEDTMTPWEAAHLPYTLYPFDAIFICTGCVRDDDHARGLHNGVDVFVI